MLRAFSETTLNIDSDEYPIDSVPNGLLTAAELAVVRSALPDALPDYVLGEEPSEEPSEDLGDE